MYNITQQGDTVQNGIIEVIADTLADIETLPTKWGAGSKCFVIEDSSEWVLGNDKVWHRKVATTSTTDPQALEEAVKRAVAESKLYTDQAIADLAQFNVELISDFPSNPNPHTIYFKQMTTQSQSDSYYEYMYINGEWELIGTTQVDLSNYYTKAEVDVLLLNNKYTLPVASTTELGGVMIDNTSILMNNGTISVNTSATALTAQEVIDNNFSTISSDEIGKLF